MVEPTPIGDWDLMTSKTSAQTTSVIEPVASERLIRTGALLPSRGGRMDLTVASISTVLSSRLSLMEPKSVLLAGVAGAVGVVLTAACARFGSKLSAQIKVTSSTKMCVALWYAFLMVQLSFGNGSIFCGHFRLETTVEQAE